MRELLGLLALATDLLDDGGELMDQGVRELGAQRTGGTRVFDIERMLYGPLLHQVPVADHLQRHLVHQGGLVRRTRPIPLDPPQLLIYARQAKAIAKHQVY